MHVVICCGSVTCRRSSGFVRSLLVLPQLLADEARVRNVALPPIDLLAVYPNLMSFLAMRLVDNTSQKVEMTFPVRGIRIGAIIVTITAEAKRKMPVLHLRL